MVDRFICLPHVSPSRSPGPEYIRSFTVTHSMKLRLALANAIARSESRVHVIVVVAALILPIRDAVTALSFDRQKYSIGWETWAGLIILALTIVGWLVARSYLKSVGTVRIGTLSGTPATLPSGVSIVPVDRALSSVGGVRRRPLSRAVYLRSFGGLSAGHVRSLVSHGSPVCTARHSHERRA
jgi:hypothetical protein